MIGCRSIGRISGLLLLAFGLAGASPAQVPIYNVGATPTGIPFTFLDAKTGTIRGAMIDVIEAIAADAGFKINVQPTPFPTLIPALTESRIDIIGAAMLISSPRREVIEFSDPVFAYPEGIVVNTEDKTVYRTLADLRGQVVGAQAGSVYLEFLKRTGELREVKAYDSLADVLREVSAGRIKAGFGDARILRYQLARNVSLRAKLVPTYQPQLNASVAIGVRKSDPELLAKINASLAKLRADGTIEGILAKWDLN